MTFIEEVRELSNAVQDDKNIFLEPIRAQIKHNAERGEFSVNIYLNEFLNYSKVLDAGKFLYLLDYTIVSLKKEGFKIDFEVFAYVKLIISW